MIINLDLVDIWREIYPETRRYTWRRKTPSQQSRLDFFLISDLLSTLVTDVGIEAGYRTDHSMITLTLTLGKESRSRLLWKFNNSLLKDNLFVKEINEVIKNVTEEYAAFPYAREQIPHIPKCNMQFVISDQLFLDVLLMKIRTKTISYATMKKRQTEEKEKNLENSIQRLETKTFLTEDENRILEHDKQELIAIREKRMQGVLLRSRARWIAEGEKITKYFCGLEKRNYVSKQMLKLTLSNGEELYETHDIIKEVKRFYERLYSDRNLGNCEILDMVENIPTLTLQEKLLLEGEITLDEASLALKNMKNNKSPGSDGFTVEFFKFFWLQLGAFVVKSLNNSFRKGELSSTQKEGVIICIPKGDKAKDLIKNWRPISLLNVVYKIGSTCIANRLKLVLPSLINEDQTGFMTNRFIGDNIRQIYDLISHMNREKLPGLLLCLDFEKAFDSVDWKFMFKVLRAFGFGSDICRWISTFYKDIKSTVTVNGQLSPWFSVQRGCRQGDPISPYLFILCVEILANMIRQNENIKGIVIGETEHKISQYADDTEIMLEGDEKSFQETINTIEIFGKASGLFLNAGKTSAIWLGSRQNCPIKYMPHLHMEWNPCKFKILGIWFTNDLKNCELLNFKDKFFEIKALYKTWLKRQITPLGRVAVLKSLILSKIIQLWILLPNPPDNLVDELQNTVFEFIWNRKQDRISRKTAIKNVTKGGLGIPKIREYINALKLIWVRKLKTSNHKWKSILKVSYPKVLLLEQLGSSLNVKDCHLNKFWAHVFQAYREFGRKIYVEKSEELAAEPLFCNDNIQVENRNIFYKNWIDSGVCYIKSILNEDGTFMTVKRFTQKYDINTNYITYIGCVQAVKSYIRKTGLTVEKNKSTDLTKTLKIIYGAQKGARLYYEVLIQTDSKPNCCDKWDYKLNLDINWNITFKKIHKIREIKLKWFQIRLVHRILATNVVLMHMGVENDITCSFCKKERDAINHIFWRCDSIKPFWEQLQIALNDRGVNAVSITLNESIVLFGHDVNFRSDDTFDLIILVAKFFIYKCKVKKIIPQFHFFKQYLRNTFEVYKHNSKVNMSYNKFMTSWHLYKTLVEP
ncbi:reverse transcriptase family protein [Thiolapillus sp.]|uniref:reverse transcriptase family protein n=1 Tax=Thiolapillus sp. TaxID=2017437 RepID=UPI003AF5292E